jgi:2-hydroxy-3-oxopropionate reductase
MIGGSADDFSRANAVLRAAASSIVHVGPVGAGETVKAANQLLVAGHIQLLAEALVFLRKHNIPLDAAVKVLAGGLAGSTVIDRKSGTMIAGDFSPSFRVDLHHKDLGIFHNAARRVGSASPLGSLVTELMASLRAQGYGESDHSALLLQIERLSGIEGVANRHE